MPKRQKGADKVTVSDEVGAMLDSAEEGAEIVAWIYDIRDLLLEKKNVGQGIRKEQIPKYYIEKYCVDNLYRLELPGYHRACYTISLVDGVWYASILEIMTHPEYDKRFGY